MFSVNMFACIPEISIVLISTNGRSFEVVNFVFTSSQVVKTVHLDLHTGTFPYTRVVNWGMNF